MKFKLNHIYKNGVEDIFQIIEIGNILITIKYIGGILHGRISSFCDGGNFARGCSRLSKDEEDKIMAKAL